MKVQAVKNSTSWQNFIARYSAQRLPHALLMVGGTLNQKQEFALTISQWLLCEQQIVCDTCNACHWVQQQSHPDLLWLPENSNETIKIDDVRQITQHLTQSSHQGKYKIVILSPAEAMPYAAMNAILKTLEEPPPQSLLLLLSQYAEVLPATLRSRCQRLVLPYEKPSSSPLLSPLADTLRALRSDKLSVIKAAEQWQKQEFKEVIDAFYNSAIEIIRHRALQSQSTTALFVWYDTINVIREQLIRKCNPNQLLTLENLFYQWVQAHVS